MMVVKQQHHRYAEDAEDDGEAPAAAEQSVNESLRRGQRLIGHEDETEQKQNQWLETPEVEELAKLDAEFKAFPEGKRLVKEWTDFFELTYIFGDFGAQASSDQRPSSVRTLSCYSCSNSTNNFTLDFSHL